CTKLLSLGRLQSRKALVPSRRHSLSEHGDSVPARTRPSPRRYPETQDLNVAGPNAGGGLWQKKILSALMPELRAAGNILSSLAIFFICLRLAAALGGLWVFSSPSWGDLGEPPSVPC